MTDLVSPLVLDDTLPDQKSDLALCVIPANKIAMDQLDVTRKNIVKYANKFGADYIELIENKSVGWPMSNKYRVRQIADRYEYTLYLDCDVIIKNEAPNIYEIFDRNKIAFADEWNIIEKYYKESLFNGMVAERNKMLNEYPHLKLGRYNYPRNRNIQPNCGVLLIPKCLSHKYSQPKLPYEKRWCFDQDYLLLNLENSDFEVMDWKYNLEFIDFDFWSKIEDSYFIHLNGSKPIQYRIELLKRLIEGNYSFFEPPKPKDDDCVVDKFRPHWRETCVNK